LATLNRSLPLEGALPRVQIEYDLEANGVVRKLQLPFVIGVLADLSATAVPRPTARELVAIDGENFNQRMAAMKPRVAFEVPNTLTGGGNLAVNLTFESLQDFAPGAVARKLEPLHRLLQAREQLSRLAAAMEGKPGAEQLLATVLANPELLRALATIARAETAE
jgi:type VI secretion system protein ImpB